LSSITRANGDDILEGGLVCTDPLCQREHPIIDGIPVVVTDMQAWAAHQLDAVLRRDDLSSFTESLLGDAAGPGSSLDRERATLSAYGRVHWGDFDCSDPLPEEASLVRLVRSAMDLSNAAPSGLWIDLGCAVGRGTFELANRGDDLAVGIDLNFAMLRVAERARRTGRAVYPFRRVGLVYDRRDLPIRVGAAAANSSFWCCDIAALPFSDAAFAGALSLNVLDVVASPLGHLMEMGRVLQPGGMALLSTPYDWAATATPLGQWLGGHSQRGPAHGSSAAELRRVLSTVDLGFSLTAERERVPWRVYVHERAWIDYAVHLMRLDRTR
jgi:SAM-dependent methyltransferase